MSHSIYDFDCETIKGEKKSLSDYQGKTLLIVNTASKCGFTPQFDGLEKLYKNYAEQGLEILGFPCNQFGHQDPGANDSISEFCSLNYGVSFDMFAKVDVNGSSAIPLYNHLKEHAPGVLGSKGIKWNFTKFLVNSEGEVIKRFAPAVSPKALEKEVVALLS